MGVIFPDVVVPCERCGNDLKRPENVSADFVDECAVCKSLGDRALVPLLRGKTTIEAFKAAPKGSVLWNVSLVRRGLPQYGSWEWFEGDPRDGGR